LIYLRKDLKSHCKPNEILMFPIYWNYGIMELMKYAIEKTDEFDEWLSSISPKQEALVRARLARIRDEAHLGEYRILGDGLVELKWKSGLRVYFIRVSPNKIRVLLGGLKNDQKKDIKKARGMF
jgi:putative addiction module killer protein